VLGVSKRKNQARRNMRKFPIQPSNKNRSKYGNHRTTILLGDEFIKFDSFAESKRALHLHVLLQYKTISELTLQPKFELQAGFKRNGKAIRAINYIADFSYVMDGVRHIEDVKGMKTDTYQMKKKLFLNKHGDGLVFSEVYLKGNRWEVVTI